MMKHAQLTSLLRAAVLALTLAITTAAAQAETKIAVVDLKKVFEGYYKTKQADSNLKERAGDAEKVLKGMMDDYQKANEEYKKLLEGSNDQAVSADERDKRKKNAEAKIVEIQEIEKSVTQYRRTTQTTIDEQKRRMRDNILKEIREVLNGVAKAASYNMVMDVSGETVNATEFVIYQEGLPDLTPEIVTKLNATAPAGALEDKKDDKKK